jgi:hypothetical protein
MSHGKYALLTYAVLADPTYLSQVGCCLHTDAANGLLVLRGQYLAKYILYTKFAAVRQFLSTGVNHTLM